MKLIGLLVLCSFLAAGCGGGNSATSPVPTAADFLTADTRGIASSVDPAAGAPSPPAGATDFGAAAEDGREQIAREIEEADLYRVSGDFLYLLNSYRGLAVVDLAKFELVGRLPLSGYPLEMYLPKGGTRAFVLVADRQAGTQLIELGVANPAAPAVSRTETITGNLRTSRIVEKVLYAITDTGVQSFRIDLAPFEPAGNLALEGGSEFAHVSDAYAFITSAVPSADSTAVTRVTLVDIGDRGGALARRGAIDLPGYIADDQKLNFGGDVLRVVTHDWVDGGLSRLFTIDITDPDAPVILATLELARGEQLFATRFTDDRAYVVTFLQVDPLWVIDLSDPVHPTIAGELEVPGFATQIFADGDRLVTLGVDTASWTAAVSLFDVSNPATPLLLDREDLGGASTNALWERKAFGVFPEQGLILLPSWEGLAVIAREADTLTLRGTVSVAGGALRGFPHGAGIVAAGGEEVVISDAATLGVLRRVTVAENVVDVGRLADGRLVNLVQTGNRARIAEAEVTLWPEALYTFGNSAAVLGWDDAGRAAYVISFDTPTPVISQRLDLGWGQVFAGGTPGAAGARDVASRGIAIFGPVYGGPEAVLTTSGKLITRGRPAGMPHVFGDGDSFDGLVVVDIPSATLGKGVDVQGGAVTGFTADGAALAFTFAHQAGVDDADRPLVREELVRIDLDTDVATAPVNVPGYVVAAQGADTYLIEELWGEEWSLTNSVVAARVADGQVQELDRLALPTRAYDLRAAGMTLFYTEGNNEVVPVLDVLDVAAPWLPSSTIGTVHLGAALAMGPMINGNDAFRWLLLPEDGAALVARDASTVEKWDVSGSEAALTWTAELSGYPLHARSDPAAPGRYLLALGFAGTAELPQS